MTTLPIQGPTFDPRADLGPAMQQTGLFILSVGK